MISLVTIVSQQSGMMLVHKLTYRKHCFIAYDQQIFVWATFIYARGTTVMHPVSQENNHIIF